MNAVKIMLRGEFIALNAKIERPQINDPNIYLIKLEKEKNKLFLNTEVQKIIKEIKVNGTENIKNNRDHQ